MSWSGQLPKVELHVHLEGAIPHSALFHLIEKYGGDPDIPDVDVLAGRFEYRNFAQFIETWSWKNGYLREYDDFTHIAELAARNMAESNIRYSEMFFSPSLFVRRGLEVQEITRAVRRGLSRVPEIEVSLIADLVRDYGPESEMVVLRKLSEVMDEGVIGIGIGGSEQEFPPRPFRELFDEARRLGFRTTAHAGEACGPGKIWEAIDSLGVERIGHATSAIHDPELLDYLAEKRLPLELCPLSNVSTGIVDSLSAHPVAEYYRRGLIVSVNTDDPWMFGNTLEDEYRGLERESGFSREDICSLVLLSIRSSWLPEGRKESLADDFRKEPSWVQPE